MDMTSTRSIAESRTFDLEPSDQPRHYATSLGLSASVPAVLVAVVAIVAAALAYQPWRAIPLDKMMGDFLPLVANERHVARVTQRLVSFYWGDGRFQPLYMLAIATEWVAFRDNGTLWQLTAFGLVLGDALLAAWLFRRLGATRLAAAIGGSVLLLGQAAAPTILVPYWIAEPLSAFFLLVAAHLAIAYRGARWWRSHAVLIALAFAASVLSKETSIATLPFIATLAATRENGDWQRPQFDRSLGWLAAMLVLATGAVAAPILYTRAYAPALSYGATYSLSTLLRYGIRALVLDLQMFLPAPKLVAHYGYGALFGRGGLAPIDPLALLHPPNLLAALLVVAGSVVGSRQPRRRRALLFGAAVALVLLLGGVAIYLPWPSLQLWYAFPYLVAVGMLLALAVTVGRGWRLWPWIACAASTAIAIVAMRDVAAARTMVATRRDLEWAVLQTLPAHREANAIYVATAVPDGGVSRIWQRWAAVELPSRVPLVHAVTCDRASELARADKDDLVVAFASECPALAQALSAGGLTIARHTLSHFVGVAAWTDYAVLARTGPSATSASR